MRCRGERVKFRPRAWSTRGDRGVSRQCGCRMVLGIGLSRKMRFAVNDRKSNTGVNVARIVIAGKERGAVTAVKTRMAWLGDV